MILVRGLVLWACVAFAAAGVLADTPGRFVHPVYRFEVSLPAGWDGVDTPGGLELTKGDASFAVEAITLPITDAKQYLEQLATPDDDVKITKRVGPDEISSPLPGAKISLIYKWGGQKSVSMATLLRGTNISYLIYGDWPEKDAEAGGVYDSLLSSFTADSKNAPTPLPVKVQLESIYSDELKVRMNAPLSWPISQLGREHVFWTLPTPNARIDLMLVSSNGSPEEIAADWEKQMTGSDSMFKKCTSEKKIELGGEKCVQADFTGDEMFGRLVVIPMSPGKAAAFSLICPQGVQPKYEQAFAGMAESIKPMLDIKTPGLGEAMKTQPLPADAKKVAHKSEKFVISLPGGMEVKTHTDEEMIISTPDGESLFRIIYLGFGGPKRNLQPQLEGFCKQFKKDNPGVKFGAFESFSNADGTWTGLAVSGRGDFDGTPGNIRAYMLRNILGNFVCIYQVADEKLWEQLEMPFVQAVKSMTAANKGDK